MPPDACGCGSGPASRCEDGRELYGAYRASREEVMDLRQVYRDHPNDVTLSDLQGAESKMEKARDAWVGHKSQEDVEAFVDHVKAKIRARGGTDES